jgi:3-phenylpropionate/trans-cinnamate dioxygenase ferredoxin reductase subunit
MSVVIVGAGQAGFQVAASLRAKKFAGPIVILGDEPALPYQRPPLSKAFLKGEASESSVLLRPADFYTANAIEVRRDNKVTAIDRDARRVLLAGGGSVSYEKLVLATGARVRTLPVPGADLAGVVYVRTLADAIALKPLVQAAKNVAVVGGGFIGLECASVAATLGCKVVVLEALERLMARVVSPVLSAYYRELHQSRGAEVRLGASVTEIVGAAGRASGVRCGDGTLLPADLVIVGIGVIPNDALASAAGIACDRGIVVDAQLRTADPHIYAIGDCAAFPHPMAQGLIRLESVQNAIDQGKTVADAIMGDAKPYTAVPWFWSDQYEIKLQIVGLTQGYDDTVTLGDVGASKFSVLYFRNGALIGIDSVNKPADHIAGRKLFGAGKTVSPATARTPGFNLRSQV